MSGHFKEHNASNTATTTTNKNSFNPASALGWEDLTLLVEIKGIIVLHGIRKVIESTSTIALK